MSPTTVVPDGSIPVGVTECDELSVVDKVDEETSDIASVDSRNRIFDFVVLMEIDEGRTQNAILHTHTHDYTNIDTYICTHT